LSKFDVAIYIVFVQFRLDGFPSTITVSSLPWDSLAVKNLIILISYISTNIKKSKGAGKGG
jgi:hypothetical protein